MGETKNVKKPKEKKKIIKGPKFKNWVVQEMKRLEKSYRII